MLFEETFPANSDLEFSLELLERARAMTKSSDLERRLVADEFLKAVDSHMTKIATCIENALPHSADFGVFLNTELAEVMVKYIMVWKTYRNFCNERCQD